MRELLIKQKVNDKVDEITDFIINEYQMPITAINYANRMLDFIFELKNLKASARLWRVQAAKVIYH